MRQKFGEEGQGFVEYALILIIVAIGAPIVLAFFGEEVNEIYHYIKVEIIDYIIDLFNK